MFNLDTRCWNCGTIYDRLEENQCPCCGNTDILPDRLHGSVIRCWRCEAVFNAASVTPLYFNLYTIALKHNPDHFITLCSYSIQHLHKLIRNKFPEENIKNLHITQSPKVYPTYPCPICQATILDNPKLNNGELEPIEIQGFGVIFRGKNRTY